MTNLCIRPGLPDDRELLAGTPARALVTALLPDQRYAGALLGFVDGELVAHGLWATLGNAHAAELAIVVADRHQRQGIGTALTYALSAELSARRIERVQVLSGAGNRAVARMIARHAPTAGHEVDRTTVTYSFPTPTTAVRPLPRVTGLDTRLLRRSA
jgi:GNAT superfamily N-acetyltransferase